MYPVRYVHAADLHLDAAFRGLSLEATGADARMLHQATFVALERLIRLCETEKPDFLVVVGDIYNAEDRSLKAQLALRDGCERLAAHGVWVFLAHGNHDPLSSRLHSLRWPDNVTIFGPDVERHTVSRDGVPVAVVHGISHAAAKESRNLARAFHRLAPESLGGEDCFQLGVLHCSLDQAEHAERYAPCALEDLAASGLDAWALGHVHEGRVVSASPFAAYSGNIQGLHCNEPGPRGCLLVTATPDGPGGFACAPVFHELGPVRWETLERSAEGLESLDAVEGALLEALEKTAAHCGAGCQALAARLRLVGRTDLDAQLRDANTLSDLLDHLRAAVSGTPSIWIKDLEVATGRTADRAALAAGEHLLGETLRCLDAARRSPETLRALAEDALNPLFAHAKARRALQAPDDAELAALLDDAERLCIDLMEVR